MSEKEQWYRWKETFTSMTDMMTCSQYLCVVGEKATAYRPDGRQGGLCSGWSIGFIRAEIACGFFIPCDKPAIVVEANRDGGWLPGEGPEEVRYQLSDCGNVMWRYGPGINAEVRWHNEAWEKTDAPESNLNGQHYITPAEAAEWEAKHPVPKTIITPKELAEIHYMEADPQESMDGGEWDDGSFSNRYNTEQPNLDSLPSDDGAEVAVVGGACSCCSPTPIDFVVSISGIPLVAEVITLNDVRYVPENLERDEVHWTALKCSLEIANKEIKKRGYKINNQKAHIVECEKALAKRNSTIAGRDQRISELENALDSRHDETLSEAVGLEMELQRAQEKTKELEIVQPNVADECERRVYYQHIVYEVCAMLDAATGSKIVCGTSELPSTQTQGVLRKFIESKQVCGPSADEVLRKSCEVSGMSFREWWPTQVRTISEVTAEKDKEIAGLKAKVKTLTPIPGWHPVDFMDRECQKILNEMGGNLEKAKVERDAALAEVSRLKSLLLESTVLLAAPGCGKDW